MYYSVASVILYHIRMKINEHHCWNSSYSVFINSYFYTHPQWFIKITEGAHFPLSSSLLFIHYKADMLHPFLFSPEHTHLSVLGLCSLTHPYPEEIKCSVPQHSLSKSGLKARTCHVKARYVICCSWVCNSGFIQ